MEMPIVSAMVEGYAEWTALPDAKYRAGQELAPSHHDHDNPGAGQHNHGGQERRKLGKERETDASLKGRKVPRRRKATAAIYDMRASRFPPSDPAVCMHASYFSPRPQLQSTQKTTHLDLVHGAATNMDVQPKPSVFEYI
ncbi:hypothetical protein LEL_04983 [Akanthomyces lecanii RCEF 1005]|uniref:Uncharacterized protein n=1 Tax=Akanthomyces lecanii RCEF 1005 TaxID=1081108 RepID=A0A168HS18_CORDF|nr:hypothetical protein LEL_04983 [Akanthomyces lecanii RCEF 1005]